LRMFSIDSFMLGLFLLAGWDIAHDLIGSYTLLLLTIINYKIG
jgi:hypothetical protein